MQMLNTTIEEQQRKITTSQPEVHLYGACTPNDGVMILSEEQRKRFAWRFNLATESCSYFIPASGSGSRMFQFLFEFLKMPSESNRGEVERFLNHVEDFAFFYQFPEHIQTQLRNRTMDIEAFVAYILNNKGMGLAHLPKGLIPFHKSGPFLLNPFHEHILQASAVTNRLAQVHFTIQTRFQSEIERQLEYLKGMTGTAVNIAFSEQNPETDAIAFTANNEPAYGEDGELIKRPAGHGALLENLNSIDSDIIFIKNIDNVQHHSKSSNSVTAQQLLAGCLLQCREDIRFVLDHFSRTAVVELNDTYQLFHKEVVANASDEELKVLLARPVRVCGMVRNEGQPGGGPFWIEENGVISKQIVEKAQISMRGEQYRVMIQSTHFNPVLLVCEGKHLNGEKVDFMNYKDDSKYFIVHKNHQGQDIRFSELPGLWNGSMAYWNSVFVEVPSKTFSPVKTILDLLDEAHSA